MHESLLVDVLQAGRRLAHYLAGVSNGQPAPLLDDRRKVFALDVLHDKEGDPGLFASVGA